MPMGGVRKDKPEPSAMEPGKGCRGHQAFHGYMSCKRKMRENVSLLLNRAGVLVTRDMEKAEVTFALVYAGKTNLWELQAPGASGKG